ncbi:MAG: hypothetical protein ACXWLH_01040 [Candidatus Saccharimonadales bacterium]
MFTGIYLVLGLIFFAVNSFSFTKGVSRHAPLAECANVNTLSLDNNSLLSGCTETDDLRWGDHFTWISWQFLSNNRGYDNAKYFPADFVLLLTLSGGINLVSRKKSIKK